MRVLMINLDKSMLGADYTGDVIERHKKYVQRAGKLDIIVFCKKGHKKIKYGPHLTIYPTNSKYKINYFYDAYRIAQEIYWPDKFNLVISEDPFGTGLVAWLIKKRFKIPLLIHFHGDFWQNRYWLWERWFNPIFLFLSKFLVDGADGIRVVSSEIRDKLIKEGVDKQKIRVIPTPVNLEKFENFNEKKVKNLREKHHPNRKVIINVGRKDPSKDYKTLYKTIELVYNDYKKLAFWQIGSGIRIWEKIMADENLILTSTRKINQQELTNHYHASDIYVSSSCHESFGKVLIEAMACGLPVVATATTGSQEIITDGEDGFLVPIGDSPALARKILYLLNNPAKAKKMGETGKKMVRKRFNQQKIIKRIIDFWQTLTSSK